MSEIAPREVTPPPLQAPTAKEKKYDRQLRLWAASGQRALEESHVLLIVGDDNFGSNSSVAGVETLKNLILPSIGSFTIADSAKVTEADLGVNFFLEPDTLNKSRAEETRRLLQELNPDVTGHAITAPLPEWLPAEGSLIPYNLVLLCAPISQTYLQRICSYASASSIPVIYIQSAGFFASLSIQLPVEFPIVDTHPDQETTQDLRLLAPWPELDTVVDGLGDISSLPDHEHGHIPYLLLLFHYLRAWKKAHDDKYPSTFKEKTEFRDFVRSGARTNSAEGGEENYDEACAAVLKSITLPPIGSGFTEMTGMPSCTELTKSSANFWIVANAIKQFYDEHGVLPLPGSLPDMKATSADYIKIQTIYKSKARADVAAVARIVRNTEAALSKSSPVPEPEIEAFCKNAAHIRVLTNPDNEPLPTLRLMTSDPKTLSRLASVVENDWESLFPVFIALNINTLPSDEPLDVTKLSSDPEVQENITKAIKEVERVRGGELHNISSVLGGMVAQEAIKLLTRQYVPVDGICVFDGVRSKSMVFNKDKQEEDSFAGTSSELPPIFNLKSWWSKHVSIPVLGTEAFLDHIENESTFMAWLNMTFGMVTFAVTCDPMHHPSLFDEQEAVLWRNLATCCYVFAILIMLAGASRFFRQQYAFTQGIALARGPEVYVCCAAVPVVLVAAFVAVLKYGKHYG